jgi:hypothetical protein
MDIQQPQRRRNSRVRERYQSRGDDSFESPVDAARLLYAPSRARKPSLNNPSTPSTLRDRLMLMAQDAWWYTLHRPYAVRGAIALVVLIAAGFVISHVSTGRTFPNVWAMGVYLGDQTTDEAAASLSKAWNSQIKIHLVDGDRDWAVSPADLGMKLDAKATADNARAAGMSGLPMGVSVMPVINLDEFTAQSYLLNMTEKANFAPYNAGYKWDGNSVVGVAGKAGRVLDVGQTMENFKSNPSLVAKNLRLDLSMNALNPEITDPSPYLKQAQTLASRPFQLTGYDPIHDETVAWSTDRDTFTSWLEATSDGLGLRKDVYAKFLDAQNASLNPAGSNVRYLEPTETMDRIGKAIGDGANAANLRIRFRSQQYTIAPGDTGYKIALRVGIPFYVITTANPGVNWDQLSVGQTINIPSRDMTLPKDPVPNKRIVVDLDTQSLTAYENGQEKFHWLISSGVDKFPTSPGIYQILDHEEIATGGSFELCSATGCGTWKMYWFMGIYEVVPGLMNGFHGAVLLANGNYLGGGNVGYPYTYGCVMSENSNAEKLYQWADEGTVVEIVSSDRGPESDLGRLTVSQASATVS